MGSKTQCTSQVNVPAVARIVLQHPYLSCLLKSFVMFELPGLKKQA